MAFFGHPQPYSEHAQQAAYNGFPYLPEFGHRRHAPREEPYIHYRPEKRGWYQGGRKLHNFRSKKYWARPVDGARHGTWGRIKDGLTGEGPDVFVVANGDRRTFHRDLPKRGHWSHWESPFGLNHLPDQNWRAPCEDMDWYPEANLGSTPWARRDGNEVYNFWNRRYSHLRPGNQWRFWSDAHWPNGQRDRWTLPTCWREWDGTWNTTVDGSAGRWPGGRPLR